MIRNNMGNTRIKNYLRKNLLSIGEYGVQKSILICGYEPRIPLVLKNSKK